MAYSSFSRSLGASVDVTIVVEIEFDVSDGIEQAVLYWLVYVFV